MFEDKGRQELFDKARILEEVVGMGSKAQVGEAALNLRRDIHFSETHETALSRSPLGAQSLRCPYPGAPPRYPPWLSFL